MYKDIIYKQISMNSTLTLICEGEVYILYQGNYMVKGKLTKMLEDYWQDRVGRKARWLVVKISLDFGRDSFLDWQGGHDQINLSVYVVLELGIANLERPILNNYYDVHEVPLSVKLHGGVMVD